MSRTKEFRSIAANCYDVNSMYPAFTREMPDESRKACERTEEGFSATVRECSSPFYEWPSIFDTIKPPHVYCNDDNIHFYCALSRW